MKHRLVTSAVLTVMLIACACMVQERADTQTSIPQLVPKVFIKEDGTEQNKDAKTSTSPFSGSPKSSFAQPI
jgi:hypothetical protein